MWYEQLGGKEDSTSLIILDEYIFILGFAEPQNLDVGTWNLELWNFGTLVLVCIYIYAEYIRKDTVNTTHGWTN